MTTIIEPKILKGTRDFLPEEMVKRNFVENKIATTFKLFGYDQIDTPAIEYAETLLGKYGDEASKLVYSFLDNGKRKIALRYDQTVPTARLVATNYPNLPMPFKRYQISKVWRADKPAKGRYREFTQCDIDIIGTKNLLAEAEVAKIIYNVFKKLGLENVIIKINSRRLINSILDSLKITSEKQTEIIRIFDKLDKIGREGIKKELLKIISNEIVEKLFSIILTRRQEGTNQEKINKLQNYSIKEVADFFKLCADFDLPEKNLLFEPSLARGLDYYTGIIYEVYIPNVNIGAVCAGGRYDNLCGMFTNKNFSGVGVSFGFDRIVLAMENKKLFKNICLSTKVMIVNFGENTLQDSLQILINLQKANINAEIYFEASKMEKQFKYANKKNTKFVLLRGTNEIKEKIIKIKNMKDAKEKNWPEDKIEKMIKWIKNN